MVDVTIQKIKEFVDKIDDEKLNDEQKKEFLKNVVLYARLDEAKRDPIKASIGKVVGGEQNVDKFSRDLSQKGKIITKELRKKALLAYFQLAILNGEVTNLPGEDSKKNALAFQNWFDRQDLEGLFQGEGSDTIFNTSDLEKLNSAYQHQTVLKEQGEKLKRLSDEYDEVSNLPESSDSSEDIVNLVEKYRALKRISDDFHDAFEKYASTEGVGGLEEGVSEIARAREDTFRHTQENISEKFEAVAVLIQDLELTKLKNEITTLSDEATISNESWKQAVKLKNAAVTISDVKNTTVGLKEILEKFSNVCGKYAESASQNQDQGELDSYIKALEEVQSAKEKLPALEFEANSDALKKLETAEKSLQDTIQALSPELTNPDPSGVDIEGEEGSPAPKPQNQAEYVIFSSQSGDNAFGFKSVLKKVGEDLKPEEDSATVKDSLVETGFAAGTNPVPVETRIKTHVLSKGEEIVSSAKFESNGATAILKQDHTGKVRNVSEGLSEEQQIKTAIQQAEMVLLQWDGKSKDIYISGQDPKQSERVVAALFMLKNNINVKDRPELQGLKDIAIHRSHPDVKGPPRFRKQKYFERQLGDYASDDRLKAHCEALSKGVRVSRSVQREIADEVKKQSSSEDDSKNTTQNLRKILGHFREKEATLLTEKDKEKKTSEEAGKTTYHKLE